jgi:hypothetical protein
VGTQQSESPSCRSSRDNVDTEPPTRRATERIDRPWFIRITIIARC